MVIFQFDEDEGLILLSLIGSVVSVPDYWFRRPYLLMFLIGELRENFLIAFDSLCVADLALAFLNELIFLNSSFNFEP